MPAEINKIKKRVEKLEMNMKKHIAERKQIDKKKIDELDARVKVLEAKIKNKIY